MSKSIFVCQNCGYKSIGWLGQCPECGKWGSLVEEKREEEREGAGRLRRGKRGQAGKILKLKEVKGLEVIRWRTGIGEVDRVLGGGIVAGSVVLVAGEPGIGKSTLLTQIGLRLAAGGDLAAGVGSFTIFYICGEESPAQVKLRIKRLWGKENSLPENFFLVPETDVDKIIAAVCSPKAKKKLVIVDSIQTLQTADLTGGPGSIGQVRECTGRLVEFAKTTGASVFLIGHVTKSGAIAGPKTIEHAVDVVLYFEGEKSSGLRLLRGVKNRFGPSDEVGVFEMGSSGLIEVTDLRLLLEKRKHPRVGAAASVVVEGARAIPVEIQALVVPSFTPLPQRVINGLDRGRVQMLLAVLQKHLKLPLEKCDVFLNVAGGLKIFDPVADLAICAAIWSSWKNKPPEVNTVWLGEVSLLGEVLPPTQLKKRLTLAKSLGLTPVWFKTPSLLGRIKIWERRS